MTLFASALLVEDEPHLAETLKIALRKLEIPAIHATHIAEARAQLSAQTPEFVLLDRALPDGDGLDLCTELRAGGYPGTILVLTAQGHVEDRVLGLNAGADDYLPKPFSWTELEARIRALARRKALSAAPRAESASEPPAGSLWQLEPERLRILGSRGWIELTPLEFKLASKLIHARGAIVTRDELLKDVWGFKLLPKTRTVDHFLGRLRKHFELNPEQPDHFITVRGAGYRFER
jgi:two-component system, OmpR family, alkaline phosphatase synthesis response regulator PhoP